MCTYARIVRTTGEWSEHRGLHQHLTSGHFMDFASVRGVTPADC